MLSSLAFQTAKAAARPDKPDYLILFVTSRCNARCRMCFNWRALEKRAGEGDLGLDEIRRAAEKIPPILQLTLSGGEPFLRDDLVEIVEAFAGKGRIRQLTLTTNAIATERVVELFSEILERFPGLRINFDLSIDAVGQAHDALRGVEGAYQAAVETYRRILALKKKHKNFRLGVTSVLSSFNLEDVIPLLEKLDEDFELDRREVMLARGDTREKAATEVPIEKFEDVHKWLLQKNRGLDHSITGRFLYQLSRRKREVQIETVRNNRMIIPCLAGRKLAVIDADGTVRPCEIIHTIHPEKDFTLGNLRENDYDFPRIMRSEKAAQVKNFIRNSRCYCTFECAILANLVFHPINLINIAARSLMPHPAKSRVEDLTNGQGSNRSNYS